MINKFNLKAEREAIETELLKLSEFMRQVDDGIGKRSDHEGNEEGPTYRVFKANLAHYPEICAAMKAYHHRGARLWQKLLSLHNRRCFTETVATHLNKKSP